MQRRTPLTSKALAEPDPNLRRASTFSGRWYTDPEVYAKEIDRIFSRTWQPVADLADVRDPGDFVTSEVAGEPIVIARDEKGDLRAFYNVCRHRAGAVALGCGKRKSLQCRYHGWTYGLDGRLLHTPEFDGVESFDKARYGLAPIRVSAFGPFVFVNLDPNADPLETWLGEIEMETRELGFERLALRARRDYVIQCNWKVYVDNYLEGYHLPIAHPGLFKELDYAAYRVETFRHHSKQHAPIRPRAGGADDARRYEEATGSERALYYWAFPNWMLNVYPDNVSINIVIPLSVDRTLTVFKWYFAEDSAANAALDRTIAFSDEIQKEDIEICEMVQARLGSRGYDAGRFSVLRENGVHHFQRLVCEWLSSPLA